MLETSAAWTKKNRDRTKGKEAHVPKNMYRQAPD